MKILKASRLFTFVRKGTMYEISTACFIYSSIFAIEALRKRRVQGHCAAYHFRIRIKILATSFLGVFYCHNPLNLDSSDLTDSHVLYMYHFGSFPTHLYYYKMK